MATIKPIMPYPGGTPGTPNGWATWSNAVQLGYAGGPIPLGKGYGGPAPMYRFIPIMPLPGITGAGSWAIGLIPWMLPLTVPLLTWWLK